MGGVIHIKQREYYFWQKYKFKAKKGSKYAQLKNK
jgi:hypothetical protein